MSSPTLVPVADLTFETFSPLEGQTFALHYGGENPEPVVLHSAKSSPESFGRPGHRPPFSLIFRAGSKEFYVPQGVFGLVHDQLGLAEIFLVPIGPDDVGMLFQAVFN